MNAVAERFVSTAALCTRGCCCGVEFLPYRLNVQVGLAEFLDFCQNASEANGGALPLLVAHNNRFDHSMLFNNCWQAGIRVPSTWLSLCSYQFALGMKKRLPHSELPSSCTLGTLAKHFGYAARLQWLCKQT